MSTLSRKRITILSRHHSPWLGYIFMINQEVHLIRCGRLTTLGGRREWRGSLSLSALLSPAPPFFLSRSRRACTFASFPSARGVFLCAINIEGAILPQVPCIPVHHV
jgi:hypothetical protein